MFGNGFDVISVVPKIFKQFINKCFAIKSLNIACKIAKEKGFINEISLSFYFLVYSKLLDKAPNKVVVLL